MNRQKQKLEKTKRRKARVNVSGTAERPRFSVFRSLKHIYAQLIDDDSGKTMAAANDKEIGKKNIKKTEIAREVGLILAKEALKKNIRQASFDKGAYKYHGRVKALADGAREGGLLF